MQNDSASMRKYTDLNEKIERSSEWVHFALVKLTVAAAKVTAIVTSLLNYYIYDLGIESYVKIVYTCVNLRCFSCIKLCISEYD